MKRALLDADPLTGIRQYFEWDEDGNEYLTDEIDTAHNQAVMDQNKRLEGQGMGKDMRLAASVSPEMMLKMYHDHGIEFWNPAHKQGVMKLLNSNEYRNARVNHFVI